MSKGFCYLIIASFVLTGCISVRQLARPNPSNYQWEAKPVLVQLYDGAPFVQDNQAWSVLPKLVIYSDGRVLKTNRTYVDSEIWIDDITIAYVSTNEICKLLTRIDSSGFFDFKQEDYVSPDVLDGGSTHMIVSAWHSNSISAYEIMSVENLPAALSLPYGYLTGYNPPGAKPYQPDRISLRVLNLGLNENGTPWPVNLPSLQVLIPDMKYGDLFAIELTGDDADNAYAFFSQKPIQYLNENGVVYEITFRPLLPLEIAESVGGWTPSRFLDYPKSNFICKASYP